MQPCARCGTPVGFTHANLADCFWATRQLIKIYADCIETLRGRVEALEAKNGSLAN